MNAQLLLYVLNRRKQSNEISTVALPYLVKLDTFDVFNEWHLITWIEFAMLHGFVIDQNVCVSSADGYPIHSGRGVHVPESFRQDLPCQTVREPPRKVQELRQTEAVESSQVRAALRGVPLRRHGNASSTSFTLVTSNKWLKNFDKRPHRMSCLYWGLNDLVCCVHCSMDSRCHSVGRTTSKIASSRGGISTPIQESLHGIFLISLLFLKL